MPPTADADAVLAREQATEATALWAVGEFDAAHQTLQQLDATLPSDARVRHPHSVCRRRCCTTCMPVWPFLPLWLGCRCN